VLRRAGGVKCLRIASSEPRLAGNDNGDDNRTHETITGRRQRDGRRSRKRSAVQCPRATPPPSPPSLVEQPPLRLEGSLLIFLLAMGIWVRSYYAGFVAGSEPGT